MAVVPTLICPTDGQKSSGAIANGSRERARPMLNASYCADQVASTGV
jgi:hypothetical protein